MAIRINLQHDARTREKIRTSQLVNRLQDIAVGKADCSPQQLKAIEILLRKTLPDLSQITLSGDADNPIRTAGTIELRYVDAPRST